MIMKCLKKLLLLLLLLGTILFVITPQHDPLQFDYKATRGTEDAVACLLHLLFYHLNSPVYANDCISPSPTTEKLKNSDDTALQVLLTDNNSALEETHNKSPLTLASHPHQ
ncbi:hypothetical protein NQD34_016743 [Xyrichtys novacula]|uniref:Secreted protein n=1 Tax=Xyrichtys novacula TaxID=13765 RepID=A0AAV1GYN7_XYRNO|nr:hypothetical protein NQD34_016743 [Xyrichtys novacula]